jgi:hypothetical protein
VLCGDRCLLGRFPVQFGVLVLGVQPGRLGFVAELASGGDRLGGHRGSRRRRWLGMFSRSAYRTRAPVGELGSQLGSQAGQPAVHGALTLVDQPLVCVHGRSQTRRRRRAAARSRPDAWPRRRAGRSSAWPLPVSGDAGAVSLAAASWASASVIRSGSCSRMAVSDATREAASAALPIDLGQQSEPALEPAAGQSFGKRQVRRLEAFALRLDRPLPDSYGGPVPRPRRDRAGWQAHPQVAP